MWLSYLFYCVSPPLKYKHSGEKGFFFLPVLLTVGTPAPPRYLAQNQPSAIHTNERMNENITFWKWICSWASGLFHWSRKEEWLILFFWMSTIVFIYNVIRRFMSGRTWPPIFSFLKGDLFILDNFLSHVKFRSILSSPMENLMAIWFALHWLYPELEEQRDILIISSLSSNYISHLLSSSWMSFNVFLKYLCKVLHCVIVLIILADIVTFCPYILQLNQYVLIFS